MVDEKPKFQLEEYIEIIFFRKWLLILPVVILVVLTAVFSNLMANIYRGQTLILVESQKIPEEFVKSIVSLDLEKRILTLQDQILSRTRLEKIIRDLDLYRDLQATLPMEEVVEIMRRNIRIEVQNQESFRIYFMGGDPYTVMKVTNRLADTFIQESLRDREKQAMSTLAFLNNELTRIKSLLEEQEEKVRVFKQEHMGELPEQQDGNQRRLDRLQDQLQTISNSLAEAENRKVLLKSSLADISSSGISKGANGDIVSIDIQIDRLKAQLADMLLKYTSAHPDVKRMKSEIAKLEQQRAREAQGSNSNNYSVTAQNRELVSELKRINLDIATLRSERGKTLSEIRQFQKRVEAAPEVEAELQILSRDYEKTKESHDDLLKKKQEAQRSANLELKQKGQQFKILDPAHLPQKPFKPQRVRIVLFGFILGLGVGFGLVFLAEHFDKSFRNAQDVEKTCGISVLSTIPTFSLKAPGQTRRYIKLLMLVGAALLVFTLITLIVLHFGFDLNPSELFGG